MGTGTPELRQLQHPEPPNRNRGLILRRAAAKSYATGAISGRAPSHKPADHNRHAQTFQPIEK
ncbi:hypothetical protein C3B79_1889 [Aeromonas hydrophila]|nr:hypothetical protein C3B79_1889 [Aeromonas hydrophila]